MQIDAPSLSDTQESSIEPSEMIFRAYKPTEIRKAEDGNGGCSMLEGISLAGISGRQTDDDGVENGSERRWTGRSSSGVGD